MQMCGLVASIQGDSLSLSWDKHSHTEKRGSVKLQNSSWNMCGCTCIQMHISLPFNPRTERSGVMANWQNRTVLKKLAPAGHPNTLPHKRLKRGIELQASPQHIDDFNAPGYEHNQDMHIRQLQLKWSWHWRVGFTENHHGYNTKEKMIGPPWLPTTSIDHSTNQPIHTTRCLPQIIPPLPSVREAA